MTLEPDPALLAVNANAPAAVRPFGPLVAALVAHLIAVVLLIIARVVTNHVWTQLDLRTGAAFALSFSQLSLIAAWLFLGPGARIWRIPVALLLAIAEPFLLAVYLDSHSGDALAWSILGGLQFLALAAALGAVRSTGLHLKRSDPSDEPAVLRFQVRHLFAWMIGASGVLIVAQWLFRAAADVGSPEYKVPLLLGLMAGSNAWVGLFAMWCVLGRRPIAPIRVVVLALTVLIVGLSYPEDRPWDRFGQLPLLAAQAILVVGTAAALRRAGFRLVSTRLLHESPGPSQELPSPHPLQSPDCGQN